MRAAVLEPGDVIRVPGVRPRFREVLAVHETKSPPAADIIVVVTERLEILHLNRNLPVWRIRADVPDTLPDDW